MTPRIQNEPNAASLYRRRKSFQVWILRLNQRPLLLPTPSFQLLLSLDGRRRGGMPFEVHEIDHIVPARKCALSSLAVLSETALEVIGHPDVQNRSVPIAEDVDVVRRVLHGRSGSRGRAGQRIHQTRPNPES